MPPFDSRKLEACYQSVIKLPVAPILASGTVACPADSPAYGERSGTGQLSDQILQARRYRRLGYRDCSNRMLEKLLAQMPTAPSKGSVDVLVDLGFNYMYSNDFRIGDSIATLALGSSRKLDGSHAGALYLAALASHRNRRYEASRQLVEQALNAARSENNWYFEIRSLSLMGVLNRDIFFGASLRAIPDHEKALALAREVRDTTAIMQELLALSLNYQDAKQMDRHFDYLLQVLGYLAVYEEVGIRLRVTNVISDDLLIENRNDDSEKLRLLDLQTAEACRSLYAWDICQRLQGFYFSQKAYDKARAYLDKAMDIVRTSGMEESLYSSLFESYYALEKATGHPDQALRWLEKAYANVSLQYTRRNADLLSRYETQFRTGEKEKLLLEKESLLQTTSRQRTIVLLFALIITLLGGLVFVGFLRQRKTSRKLSDQNETISTQAEELKSLEALKSRFFANVSHELRTPLTLLLGPVSLLLKRDYLQPKDRSMLRIVHQNASQLLKLVNEILDLSKLETGKLEIRETAVNLSDFLRPTVAQFSSFGDSGEVKLVYRNLTDPSLNLYLDTGKFEKIVHNFLSNALKFTPKGGKVDMTVTMDGGQLIIGVSDTGSGIHPGDLPHIFDRFYQSRQPDLPVQGGTGIGLSLCRELAELMGGKVWATSQFGAGSSFFVEMPVLVAPKAEVVPFNREMDKSRREKREPVPSASKPSDVRHPVILMVEDNAGLREYVQTLLSDAYEVRTAANGREGLDLLEGGLLPVLIISDLMMPVMDGFEFLERVKGSDAYRHIPVILLTARTDVQVKLRALRTGIDDYMNKPFVEEELRVRIENLLRNYRERLDMARAEHAETQDYDKPLMAAVDNEWLIQVEQVFNANIGNDQLNIEFAAGQLNISSRQFTRRLKQLTGLTPNQYLQEMRLQRARDLILQGRYATVREACFAVGFSDVRYFSRLFLQRFGTKPTGIGNIEQ